MYCVDVCFRGKCVTKKFTDVFAFGDFQTLVLRRFHGHFDKFRELFIEFYHFDDFDNSRALLWRSPV